MVTSNAGSFYTNICWYETEKLVADTKSCLYVGLNK